MLTVESLRNPQRASGFNRVATHPTWTKKDGTPRYRFQINRHQRGESNIYGPSRDTAEEAAQDYCDYVNGGSVLTIEDIRNPSRKSGFAHVSSTGTRSHPLWRAVVSPGRKGASDAKWRGPARRTSEEAAQDYCDYINGQRKAVVRTLKNAGHPTRPVPARNEEVEAALGVLRDHRAQRRGTQGYVYLIGEAHDDALAVKIGYSTNPEARVGELQAGNPRTLALLAKKPGTEADERALHARYIEHNVLLEWFRPTHELLSEFGIQAEEAAA